MNEGLSRASADPLSVARVAATEEPCQEGVSKNLSPCPRYHDDALVMQTNERMKLKTAESAVCYCYDIPSL